MTRNTETTYDITEELTLLAPGRVRLFHDEFEDLCLRLDEGAARPVSPKHVFPLSSPERFVALADREGDEIGVISDTTTLDEESRRALAAELERDYFCAHITRVVSMTAGHRHVQEWEVETDRGARTFEIRSHRRDIRDLGSGRVLIRDADGNRFEIPNYRDLDPVSRTFVEGVV